MSGFRYKEGTTYSGAIESRFDSKNKTFKRKSDGKEFTVKGIDNGIAVTGWFINSLGQLLEITAFQNGGSTVMNDYGASVSLRFKVFNTVTFVEVSEYAVYNASTGVAHLEKTRLHISTKTKTKQYPKGSITILKGKAAKKFFENSAKGKAKHRK